MSEIIFSTSGRYFSPYRREIQTPDKMSCSEKSSSDFDVTVAEVKHMYLPIGNRKCGNVRKLVKSASDFIGITL